MKISGSLKVKWRFLTVGDEGHNDLAKMMRQGNMEEKVDQIRFTRHRYETQDE